MDVHYDIVGDVHGQPAALRALLEHLGYTPSGASYQAPAGRHLVFVGDLIDYGPDSFGAAELVRRLVADEVATCLMGNHEYNFLEAWYDIQAPRHSGAKVYAAARADEAAWGPIVEFFAELPVALDFGELRVIHAVWHEESLDGIWDALGRTGARTAACPTTRWWASPFEGGALRDLPHTLVPESNDRYHAVILKGLEQHCAPYQDTSGVTRTRDRVRWWETHRGPLTVFGHYRSLPPTAASPVFAPPAPQGSAAYMDWAERTRGQFPGAGSFAVPHDVAAVCIDQEAVSCILKEPVQHLAALRWPEREVVWASTPR